ncbi:CPBP family intramembrane metalloprotease (plasmid) [Bacillus mycoides]|uniref:CAAX amino terminal protease n=2 Tax=Bacillus mycoides TaxID=1405 RepID=C2Y2Z8_BACMY|nr:CPBP family intramembrane glutamic endopeptidase [Bacillus mycoides]KXY32345.1 CAAX protease [Bacillus cereus]ARJ25564.1 CPBP family intramembrane metalloprotease [Bacillus mycoides]EEL67693.1 CAAX amino terminal protease [Bacillus mycoides]NUC20287.1 CPBP family intramembrane metalloprotease [Bacillus mycoides]QWG53685.1 CPBP family intramembrane metalloprotease [Bacillus mycoides]
MFRNIHNFLSNLNKIPFILLMTIISFLITIPLNLFLPPSQANPSINESIIEHILLVLIIAPFLETLLFQKVLFFILQLSSYISERNILTILIASIIFGLTHQFDITYIAAATLMGIVFNYSYSIYQEKNYNDPKSMSAFWIVFWIHELHNTIAFLIIEFGQKL